MKYRSLLQLEESVFDRPDFEALRFSALNEFYPAHATAYLADGTPIGKCGRSIWFEKAGIRKEDLPVRVKRRFDFGHIAEDYFVEKHKALGIFVDREKSFGFRVPGSDIIVRGRFDEIVILDAKYVGVEFKTGHGHRFISQHITGYKRKPKYVPNYMIDPTQPAPRIDYILQAALYLYYGKYILPLINGVVIDEWHLVHLAIDSMAAAEFVITLEEVGSYHRVKVERIYVSTDNDNHDYDYMEIKLRDIYVENIFEKFQYIYNMLKSKRIPPADYIYGTDDDDWQCNYCSYRYICDNLPKEETDGTYLIDLAGAVDMKAVMV